MSIVKPKFPWQAFPDLSAESSGWRQGDAEHWWNTCWQSYWEQLNSKQKQEIINNTECPKDWKEKLKYFI